MTDEWMDEFVYQVVVDPSFVEKEVRDALKMEPMVLSLWDPMGALTRDQEYRIFAYQEASPWYDYWIMH